MDIKDDNFRAKASHKSGKSYHFDAIECLVNYLKTKDELSFSELLVTDYPSGKYIAAKTATFLKSEGLPSPMGADLSAFENSSEAQKTKTQKGGETYSWEEIKKRFETSNFGSLHQGHHNHNRADSYAPTGIMGDHLHPKGGLMISLKYMNMAMSDNLRGSDEIADDEIFQEYMVAPQEMTMQMYMLGIMYAPSDKLTLMLMQNIAMREMDLTARMSMPNGMTMLRDFSTSSDGLGDLKLGVLYGLLAKERISFHLNGQLNFPIGDIQNRDATPMMADAKLPYAMQLGSGTFDITLGGTLKGSSNQFSWGLQQLNTIRTGMSSEDYRFGNIYQISSWLAYGISQKVSTSIRIAAQSEGEIEGADPELNPMMVTTADTANYGGELVRGSAGLNVLLVNNSLILGAELGLPLYQNYNGIFMEEDLTLQLSAKYNLF